MTTFTDLWLLNEEEAKRLTQRILDTERMLREQQLGLPAELPALDLYVTTFKLALNEVMIMNNESLRKVFIVLLNIRN